MQTVIHSKFGVGKVIKKEVKKNDIYITVLFDSGRECRFAAVSFRMGVLTVEGALKDEIDAVLEVKRLEEAARKVVIRPSPITMHTTSLNRHGKTPAYKLSVKGGIQVQYEIYLQAAGYSVLTPKGNPSTVPQYSRAIEKTLEKERLTWSELKTRIANIIPKYDNGGIFEDFGNRSNKTVINALKRFGEFVSA